MNEQERPEAEGGEGRGSEPRHPAREGLPGAEPGAEAPEAREAEAGPADGRASTSVPEGGDPGDDPRNPDIPEADLRKEHGGWLGANPYYLIITPSRGINGQLSQSVIEIDLDQKGWTSWYANVMRAVAQWYLVRKSDRVVVATMLVHEGEQPYYVARHVGWTATSGEGGGETTNYGIGKKRLDGHVDRIWVMANGCITLGDDVEPISLDLLKAGML